jgi:hypothetical protein
MRKCAMILPNEFLIGRFWRKAVIRFDYRCLSRGVRRAKAALSSGCPCRKLNLAGN